MIFPDYIQNPTVSWLSPNHRLCFSKIFFLYLIEELDYRDKISLTEPEAIHEQPLWVLLAAQLVGFILRMSYPDFPFNKRTLGDSEQQTRRYTSRATITCFECKKRLFGFTVKDKPDFMQFLSAAFENMFPPAGYYPGFALY